MTYTFKLARRLAVSRSLVMLPAILLFVACSGDTTALESSDPLGPQDDWRPRAAVPVTVSVNPSSVTVETNQLIRFLAYGRNGDGDSVYAPISWRATGGTILPDGRFSSAAVGDFMITGTTSTRGEEVVDTSMVKVVRRQLNLKSIRISPEAATLAPGVAQDFNITGRLPNGTVVQIGAVWTATGGTIDAGGNYVAGDTAGTYQVIASNTAMTLADTAIITITAPPTPLAPTPPPPPPSDSTQPPPPPPDSTPESPAPTLASVTLLPASATLAPSATRQFSAYGRTTTGDSVAIGVVFTARGGTITAGGLYTAGSTAGTYRVFATLDGLVDTSFVTITQPLGSGPAVGTPFGAFNTYASSVELKPNAQPFSLSHDPTTALNILDRITSARNKGITLSLAIVGGAHSQYLTDGVFDKAKWTARLQTFNTPTIRQAVAAAVSDGTVFMGNVMDEPFHPSWGPSGTLTKARVDSLCADMKAVFPTLPVGPTHDHSNFEPTKSYRVCDFILSQFRKSKGDRLATTAELEADPLIGVKRFRDAGLALARRDGHAIAFSMNILAGGTPDRDGTWDCAGIGGKGTLQYNCWMTGAQVREFGRVLGPAGCAMLMWRYDDAFMANPDNIQAFRDVAETVANVPRKSCLRP